MIFVPFFRPASYLPRYGPANGHRRRRAEQANVDARRGKGGLFRHHSNVAAGNKLAASRSGNAVHHGYYWNRQILDQRHHLKHNRHRWLLKHLIIIRHIFFTPKCQKKADLCTGVKHLGVIFSALSWRQLLEVVAGGKHWTSGWQEHTRQGHMRLYITQTQTQQLPTW